MADPRDDDEPEYNLYRSKPKLFGRKGDDGGLREMQQEAPPQGYEDEPGWSPQSPSRRRRRIPFPLPRRRGRRISVWRVLRWLITLVVAWLAISLVLFLVSAQIESSKVSSEADQELSGG